MKGVANVFQPQFPFKGIVAAMAQMGFNPRTLFANNEPGVWYDPSDLSTLFQDAAGTTPVTAVEQPVGLLLDKSKGLVRGPELVTDPGFNDPSAWSFAGVTPGWSVSGGKAEVTQTAAGNRWVSNGSRLTIGKTYLVRADVTVVAGGCAPDMSAVGAVDATSSGPKQWVVTASTQLLQFIAKSTFIGSIDNISVRELPGNHAYQTTATSRPVLSARYNLLSSSANVSATPWTSTVGTFSFSPTAPYIGSEAYRVTNNGTGTFRFIAHPFTAQVGTYAVSAIVEEDIANPSEYTDLGMLQAPSTTLGRIRIHWPTGTVGLASGSPMNARRSLLSAVGPNGGRVFSLQFEIPVTAVGEHRVLFYPSSTTQNTTGVILHCVDARLFVDAALPSFQPVVSQTEYQTEGFPHYLRFDGVDDHLSIPRLDFSGASSAVAVIGMTKTNDVTSARPCAHGVRTLQTGAFEFLAPANPGQASLRVAVRGANGTISETAGANDKPAPIKTVMLASYGNGESTTVRFNGSETRVASGGPLAGLVLPNARAIVGAQVTGDTTQAFFFVGRISGLLHIGRSLSEGERRAVERFINSKTRAY